MKQKRYILIEYTDDVIDGPPCNWPEILRGVVKVGNWVDITREKVDGDFRTLVRLAKKWRNRIELKPLKSFAIELIMAHVLAKNGKDGSIEKRFRDFLLYVAQSELKEVITFPENGKVSPTFTDPVVILDPVCNTNNVASRISDDERKEIVAAAMEAWETANFASTEDDIEVWKELFGPRFKVKEEA